MLQIGAKLCLAFVFFLGINDVSSETVQGSILLNSGVFDKIIGKFKAVLVKFDETYPYGDKQDTYKAVVEATLSQSDILCAEVQVADYGEKENADIAEKYGAKKDDFPVYKLFVEGKEEPLTYKGDVKKADDIKKFLIRESGLWLGLPSCLEDFDKLVAEFRKTPDEKKADILTKAEELAEKYTTEKDKRAAEIYVKTMKKLLETPEFVDTEIKRVEKLKDGKVSDKKKEQLNDRLNILTSFQMRLKDEL
ncbi:endoplasmic reticulum resident protein 29-like [Saccostrea echinata]|uniref:endoplasmic reticulum resident protein 29-like n=1 Tax=Saccostrea echinata TaxID=191078 RepID=UPI002A7F1F0D|nr:endoplasmic reticulum resident protein 29-like [Saccostrea echinata]